MRHACETCVTRSLAAIGTQLCTGSLECWVVRNLSALGCHAGVMQMKVPASDHRLVSLAIMETYVRYNRVLQHSQHCLPGVLQTFLGDKGIGHPDKVILIHRPTLPVCIPATGLCCITASTACQGCCKPS